MNSSDLHNHDKHFSSYKEGFSPDVEAGLRRLHTRTGSGVQPQVKVRRLTRRAFLSAAAAILLLLTAGYLVFGGNGNTVIDNSTDEPMAVTLADGTEVLLQQGSALTYGPDYNVVDRLIDLQGQAYFKVTKNANRPFLVSTSETELRVTGTAFNLRIQDGELDVEVSEGSVELHRDGEVVTVNANHRGLAVPGKVCTVMTARDLNRHAWRTGVLRFQGVPLSDAIKTISDNYGYSIDYPAGCEFPVSSTFSIEDPVSVLQTIADLGQGELEVVDEASGKFALVGICH